MINDLAKINLNLLIALDVLLKEKHVTNAGKRLHITQSAMSNLLKQLREIFNDELFFRGQAGRLIPTAYALALAPRVTEAIEKIALVFTEPQSFIPYEAKISFTLALSDYTEYLFLSPLVERLSVEAPQVNLVIKHLTYIENINTFENDDVDMAIGIFRNIPELLIAQLLFTDQMVCMGSVDNPILKKPLDIETFSKAKHLTIRYAEPSLELLIDQVVREAGYERRSVVTVSNTLPALEILLDTDLIAVVMQRLATQYCKNSKLIYQRLTFSVPERDVTLVWHPKHKNNLAHRWLREVILQIAAEAR